MTSSVSSWRPLPTALHPLSCQLPPRPPSRWRRSLRSPREPLSRGGAVCARWGLPGQCWLPSLWHGARYSFSQKAASRCFATFFCCSCKYLTCTNQVMACQCYLNFVATPSTAAETCPRTGVCTNALDVAQVTRSGVVILILANSLRFEKKILPQSCFHISGRPTTTLLRARKRKNMSL